MELSAIADLVDALSTETETGARTYQAVVSRIDNDGTVWVNLAGSNMATPTASTSSEIEPNDDVTVEWRNNKLYIVGNTSNPSAGSLRVDAVEQAANQARTAAQSAVHDAEIAHDAAEEAQNSLKSVVQGATTVEKAVSVMQTALEAVVEYDPTNDTVQEYFWHDANGAHVLGDTSGYRNDIDSNGMKIVDVSTEDVVAEFGTTVKVGKEGDARIVLENDGIRSTGTGGGLLFSVNETDTYETTNVPRERTYNTDYASANFSTDENFRDAYNAMSVGSYFSIDIQVNYTYQSGSSTHATTSTTTIGSLVKGSQIMNQDQTTSYLNLHYSYYSSGYFSVGVTGRSSSVKKINWVKVVLVARVNVRAPAFKFGTNLNKNTDSRDKANSFSIGDGTRASANGFAMGTYNNYGTWTKAFVIGNGSGDLERSNALSVGWDGNIQIAIDTTAVSGDDFNLYTARSDLGWASDVIV